MVRKSVSCEVCNKKTATAFSLIPDQPNTYDGKWAFSCRCTETVEVNPIPITTFFASDDSQREWIQHLQDKNWFDYEDFMDMLARYEAERNS